VELSAGPPQLTTERAAVASSVVNAYLVVSPIHSRSDTTLTERRKEIRRSRRARADDQTTALQLRPTDSLPASNISHADFQINFAENKQLAGTFAKTPTPRVYSVSA
jgi:hypothetical protein